MKTSQVEVLHEHEEVRVGHYIRHMCLILDKYGFMNYVVVLQMLRGQKFVRDMRTPINDVRASVRTRTGVVCVLSGGIM